VPCQYHHNGEVLRRIFELHYYLLSALNYQLYIVN
jgi:hypothetical protein